MSEDEISRDTPTGGRRGRRSTKGRASSAIARPKAPQRPRVSSRTSAKSAAEEPQPSELAVEVGGTAVVEAQKADKKVAAPSQEDAGASGEGEENRSGASEVSPPPEKRIPKRRSPAGKAGAAKPQASPEAQDPPQRRGKAGAQRGTRQRADSPAKRVDAAGGAAPSVSRGQPTAPEHFDLPTVDPMAGLAELADRSLQESLQSLRSVAESRTLSKLFERQSRHMRLMTEIWMRQAQRSMEVFNAMLSQRRE
jgi:hypothetical protein